MSTKRGDTLSVLLKKAISIIDRQYCGQAPGKAEAMRVRNQLSSYIKYGKLAAENEALRAERDGLATLVDRLREWVYDTAASARVDYSCGDDTVEDYLPPEYSETPAQSLAHIRAAGAREALERAMAEAGLSGTVVRVDLMREIIEQMEGE